MTTFTASNNKVLGLPRGLSSEDIEPYLTKEHQGKKLCLPCSRSGRPFIFEVAYIDPKDGLTKMLLRYDKHNTLNHEFEFEKHFEDGLAFAGVVKSYGDSAAFVPANWKSLESPTDARKSRQSRHQKKVILFFRNMHLSNRYLCCLLRAGCRCKLRCRPSSDLESLYHQENQKGEEE